MPTLPGYLNWRTMSFRAAITELSSFSAKTWDAAGLTAWQRSLRELLAGHVVEMPAAVEALLQFDWVSPATVAGRSLGEMLEQLKPVPRGSQKAGVVKALANWWVNEFGDDAHPAWTAGRDYYRAALREIRGLGPETVDRLLLFAAEQPVVPIDRATLRVAVRHGWLDLPVSDDEAQATFLAALGPEIADLQAGVRRLHRIGTEFCGRVPDCERCPLQPYLPSGGPLSPDAC